MAVAAYASLISLTQVLNNVHNRAVLRNIHVDIKQIEYLQEGVNYLVGFLEAHSQSQDQRVKDLWRQISEVAFGAEEIFDLHVVNQLQEGERSDHGDESDFLAFCEELKSVIQKIDFIKTELSVIKEVRGDVHVGRQSKVSIPVGGSMATSSKGKNFMVGFDEHLLYIMDELTKERKLKILPITGMGGIGKTTLAKNVFDNRYIVNHFDMKIWLTISQEYSVHEILTDLLNDGRGSTNVVELGQRLYQKLFGRRYLIVMDDVWSFEAWNDFKRFFPDNGNGSRILITTRLTNVASSLGSSKPYSLSFLDEERSWNLFCQTIFGQENCPFPELKEIGKSIAKSCRGLPLEIIVIGGLLANSDMTWEFWKSIAENVSSFGNSGFDEHGLKILSLSYTNLPIHLKPCFLYLRSYPEDHSIQVLEMIKWWIAEGFIKPVNDQNMEENAMAYVKDLISRNLIFVREWKRTGEVETCGVHDLLRDLCLREFDKECFVRSPKVQRVELRPCCCIQCGKEEIHNELHNFVHISPLSSSSSSQISLSICGACKEMNSHLRNQRLVRIIDSFFPKDVVHPTQVRYVWGSFFNRVTFIFPSLLHLLWNLQMLEMGSFEYMPVVLPNGIWKLPDLRHLVTGDEAILPNPVDNEVEGKDFFILRNLQTLTGIKNMKCTKDVLDRIPNLKTLKIWFEDEDGENTKWSTHLSLCNIAQLKTLQSLGIEKSVLEGIILPNSLKELVLTSCIISWEDMSIIGLLPNLELLSLDESGEGSEWAPVEGEFLQLKVLEIMFSDLVKWRADRVHFPKLEWLFVGSLLLLEEIPLGIGDIETLHTIKLHAVSESVEESARQILDEQECMGNENLQIYVDGRKIGGSNTE